MPSATRKRTLLNPHTKERLFPSIQKKIEYDTDYHIDFVHSDRETDPYDLLFNLNDLDISPDIIISPTGVDEREHSDINSITCESVLDDYQWESTFEVDNDDKHKPHKLKSAAQSPTKKLKLCNFTEEHVIATIHQTSTEKDAAKQLDGASGSSLSKFLRLRSTNYKTVKENPNFFFQRNTSHKESIKKTKHKKQAQTKSDEWVNILTANFS